jgi:hypothetical protein
MRCKITVLAFVFVVVDVVVVVRRKDELLLSLLFDAVRTSACTAGCVMGRDIRPLLECCNSCKAACTPAAILSNVTKTFLDRSVSVSSGPNRYRIFLWFLELAVSSLAVWAKSMISCVVSWTCTPLPPMQFWTDRTSLSR